MAGFTNREYKAIFAVAKAREYTIRLSTKPWVYFYTKDRTPISMRISDVLDEYNAVIKEQQRNKRFVSPTSGLGR